METSDKSSTKRGAELQADMDALVAKYPGCLLIGAVLIDEEIGGFLLGTGSTDEILACLEMTGKTCTDNIIEHYKQNAPDGIKDPQIKDPLKNVVQNLSTKVH